MSSCDKMLRGPGPARSPPPAALCVLPPALPTSAPHTLAVTYSETRELSPRNSSLQTTWATLNFFGWSDEAFFKN